MVLSSSKETLLSFEMKCEFIKEVLLNIKKYAFYQESKFLPTCSATKQNKKS